jgi:ParG
MSGKTVQFKMPSAPKTADAWVGQGIEPHLGPAKAPAVKMKRFTIDVDADLHARVKTVCARRGLLMADEVRRILALAFPADAAKS